MGGTNPALLQAMGAGAAVVALDTPFNREPLGDAGVTFTSGQELPEVLHSLWDDEWTRHQLGQRARQRVREEYSWETVCAAYERELCLAAGVAVPEERPAITPRPPRAARSA